RAKEAQLDCGRQVHRERHLAKWSVSTHDRAIDSPAGAPRRGLRGPASTGVCGRGAGAAQTRRERIAGDDRSRERRADLRMPRQGHLRALLTRQTITSSPPSDRPVSNVEEHMNTKRWLLASVAVFVVIGVLEFLVHGVLLSGLYKQTASVWRPEAEMRQMMWI